MKVELSSAGIIMTVVGLIVSILGMLSFTGLVNWGIPSGVMFTGYPITIAGLVLIYADLRANRELLEKGSVSESPLTGSTSDEEDGSDEDPLFLTRRKD